jgi:LysM repeat protein
MRKIALGFLIFTLAAGGARAQDAATQQQIDKLTGQLQDVIDAEAAQSKRIDALEHDVADLRDKVNAPPVNNYASADDLQKIASQLQEIDRKRQDDKELILGKIEDLAKISAEPVHTHHAAPAPRDTTEDTTPADDTKPAGYDYPVKAGDSLTAIVRAYREKGVKTTLALVMKANPGLSSKTLYAGKIIRIPDPAMK